MEKPVRPYDYVTLDGASYSGFRMLHVKIDDIRHFTGSEFGCQLYVGSAYSDGKPDVFEVKQTFNEIVALKANHQAAVQKYYADDEAYDDWKASQRQLNG